MATIKSWSKFDWKSMDSCENKSKEGGKQYNSKADLWEGIKMTMTETEAAEVK